MTARPARSRNGCGQTPTPIVIRARTTQGAARTTRVVRDGASGVSPAGPGFQNASFQILGQVFSMTRGGPNGATRVSIQHIYESAFRDAELGYASAMSVVLFAVMMTVSALQFRFMKGDES